VLLEIFGLGVLLIGASGAGKSECALDLITRGHSLVADDRVTAKRYPHGDLMGFCQEPLRHHMEVRGLGIVNVQDLFGLAAVRERKSIDLVIELEPWDESNITLPVALGRNLSILVEIAARNHVLKLQGHHSAKDFARELEKKLQQGSGKTEHAPT
jgi:HPr kinase/phosphorylase